MLLDTHTVIWLLAWPEKVSPQALAAIEDRRNSLWVSMASVWEAEIKQATGKLHLSSDIWDELSMKDIQFLPIERLHCQMLAKLPFHHRDPFDRMLVAQALCQSLVLVSADAALLPYPAPILW